MFVNLDYINGAIECIYPDTQVNGLSSFEALNTKELDRNYGLIERLMYGGDTLFAVCQNRIVSNYIGNELCRST